MVQIKQKVNKINITALITCFMLIMVFVFGCVQYVFADSRVTPLELATFKPMQYYLAYNPYRTNGSNGVTAIGLDISSDSDYRVCGIIKANGNDRWGIYTTGNVEKAYDFMCSDNATLEDLEKGNFTEYYPSVYKNSDGITSYGNTASYKKVENVTANIPVFEYIEDVYTYLETGQINNAIFQPKEEIEYDSDMEVPLNLDIQLNGSSNFVPNVEITCNQSETMENRVLEVSYSIGYRATWHLMGGIGLNIRSKTSPVVYGSVEQLEENYDNSGLSFEQLISLSKLSNSKQPDKGAFDSYKPSPSLYWSLKEIKNQDSEMKIWVRNRVGNRCSKWVMVSGDSYKANFDVVDSDENGNPTDLKDNSANADTGYGSDYWNNRDTTPQEDYSSTNVKTNLKDLKSNYTSLANFYKELFSFLPDEIWIILIGLVSTMVIIAIVKFVRG